jgi:flavin-dependent dehydrogenase
MKTDFDVVVVGAGPAGTSAAIFCRKAGLSVALVEGQEFPRFRPGEFLHPGAEALLDLLEVKVAVRKLDTISVKGVWKHTKTQRRFVPFGDDAHGAWVGLQVDRAAFDGELLKRACATGSVLLQPCRVSNVMRVESGWLIGTRVGELRTRLLIDATGSDSIVAKQLGLKPVLHSPQIIAKYGYGSGRTSKRFNSPMFFLSKCGWMWIAKVGREKFQWITASWTSDTSFEPQLPSGLLHLAGISRSRGANVTWRILNKTALPNYFSVGDAAAVLDPSSSHGVIRALATGIKAGFWARRALHDAESSRRIANAYDLWVKRWFEHDVRRLQTAYSIPSHIKFS